jgi:hypothetical protein
MEVPFFLVSSAADPQGIADDLLRALKRTCISAAPRYRSRFSERLD